MGALAFVATAWGPRFGGINAFNEDLCRAVASTASPDVPVICFAFSVTSAEVDEAREAGVRLIALAGEAGAGALPAYRAHELVHLSRVWGEVDFWIGHDVISGPVAVLAAGLSSSRSAVIQHTDYASYGALKGTAGDAILSRDRAEVETLLAADVVYGVGPKLTAAARDRVRRSEVSARVVQLTPGLPAVPILTTPPSTFRAITFGRLDAQSDRIKQGRLAVHAFAGLVRELPEVVGGDPRISVIGVSSSPTADGTSEQDELMRLAAQHAGRSVSVVGHPFTEDRNLLFHALSDASVCLMLSVHEGFGLTGWEAIGGAVPLVVSRNSGLYQLLKEVGDHALGCVRSIDVRGRPEEPFYQLEDVADATKALREVALDPLRAKRGALALREILSSYTWENTARDFLDALGQVSSRTEVVSSTAVEGGLAGGVLPANNLAMSDDAFIGRDAEVERLRALVLGARSRLVTLVGTAGSGKTRLAQETANQVLAQFDDHVYFVDLSAVADPSLVIASITRALRIEARDPVLDALMKLFASKRALLVLDNFEQVLDAAVVLQDLLAGAPGLHILATSREPMKVASELQFDVMPLTSSAAATLFAERSATGGSEDLRTVTQLCSKLDNLPLAIELVAARARLFSAEQLLKLDSLLDVAARRRDIPGKQRSLRAAIDWSYELLTFAERRLFCQLSVFAGGWTVGDAWQVLTGKQVDVVEFAEGLEALLDKRLLRMASDGSRRFDMLQILREYAREHLEMQPDEAEAVREAHANHWLDVAEGAHADPLSRTQTDALLALEPEQDNLEAALAWFVGRGLAVLAFRMAAACSRSWWTRDCAGGLARIASVLRLPVKDDSERERAIVLLWSGRLAIRLGQLEPAERDISECVSLAQLIGDEETEATATADLALVYMERSDWARVDPLLQRAMDIYHRHPAWSGVADVVDNLGVAATGRADYGNALKLLREARGLYGDDETGKAWIDNDLARVYLALGDNDTAEAHAAAAYHRGLRQADPQLICWARNYLGLSASGRGAFDVSSEHHRESLAAATLLGDDRPIALALEGVAALRAGQGHYSDAVTLSAAADAHRRRRGLARTAADLAILELRLSISRQELGPAGIRAAEAVGASMTLEQAVAFAQRE